MSKVPSDHSTVSDKFAARVKNLESVGNSQELKLTTREFFLDDFNKTLFPLKTNKLLVELGESEIISYIKKCLDVKEPSYSFLHQRRLYASKVSRHVRRTVKLDVVTEYYFYDLTLRNRVLFRKPHVADRQHYGYRFDHGSPITPTSAYKGFRGAISEYGKTYKYSMSFDVAAYFNSIYHYDLVSWFSELKAKQDDVDGFSQVLREINSARSIECLPQGIYPTKMIGNDFLRFIENYFELKSAKIVRFMDDICLFSDVKNDLHSDFQIIQKLLGDKGLSVNPQKTRETESSHIGIEKAIDVIKKSLLDRRRLQVMHGYDDEGDAVVSTSISKLPFSREELNYVDGILGRPEIEEEDAELILTIMGEHARRVESRIPYILEKFPHLTKNVYNLCGQIENKEFIAEVIITSIRESERLMEFQLFWYAAILEDFLMETTKVRDLLNLMFNHRSATVITRAKILEIPCLRHGLPELRNDYLQNGQSDWLAWSSAAGSRDLQPVSRNHMLKYFAKNSNMNQLISVILSKNKVTS